MKQCLLMLKYSIVFAIDCFAGEMWSCDLHLLSINARSHAGVLQVTHDDQHRGQFHTSVAGIGLG